MSKVTKIEVADDGLLAMAKELPMSEELSLAIDNLEAVADGVDASNENKKLQEVVDSALTDDDVDVIEAPELSVADVCEMIGNLEVNDKNYTKGGKPDAVVLSDIANQRVSSEMRDEAFALYQEQKGVDSVSEKKTSKKKKRLSMAGIKMIGVKWYSEKDRYTKAFDSADECAKEMNA